MDKLVVNSPAKINLGLNIISKRSDGYHDLNTIFYPLKLSDKITFTKSDTFNFDSNNSDLLKENLIIKAKEQLEKESNKKINTDIYLEKNIPIGAGLGGGSSNAAITLKSLNKLFELGFSEQELKNFALKLGSDVPFFIDPIPSFATSRGEVLKQINLKLEGYLLLVNPGIHISTKWAFDSITLKNNKIELTDIPNQINRNNNIAEILTNDFEDVVFKEYPEIGNIKKKILDSGAYFSLMTGTGSTVYGLFDDLNKVEFIKEEFPKNYFIYIEKL